MTLTPTLMSPTAPSGTTLDPVATSLGAAERSPPAALVPIPLRAGLVFAATAPIAAGAVLFARSGDVAPLAVTPAVALGVAAITSPALYIALAATGDAPPLAVVARAVAMALAAFGIALAGLLLPAAFLSLSAVSPWTAVYVVSAALGTAALIALVRLASELDVRGVAGRGVLIIWAVSTVGVAGRLWFDVVAEVLA